MPLKSLRMFMCVCSLLAAAPVAAQAQSPEAEVEKLLKRAIGDYDNLNLARATVSLQAALTVAQVHKLRGALVARCYLRMGLILVAQGKQDAAVKAFVNGIRADPKIKPDAAVMNPKASAAFEKARKLAPPPAPPPPRESDFSHTPPTGGDEGKPVRLSVEMAKARKGLALTLRYRFSPSADFEGQPVASDQPGVFEVTIPGKRVRPPELIYFFQVRDQKGKLLLTLGSAERPFRVAIKKAPPQVNESDFLHVPPATGEEDRSLKLSVRMPQRKEGVSLVLRFRSTGRKDWARRDLLETVVGEFATRIPGRAMLPPSVSYYFEVRDDTGEVLLRLGSASQPYEVKVQPAAPLPPPPRPPSVVGAFRISLGVGTSLGVVGGNSDQFTQEIKRGTAFAPLNSSIELGYAVTPNLELGANARIQIAPGTTFGVEPRVRWLPLTTGIIRPYAQFGIPILQLRYNVDLRPVRDADDTVTAGFVGIGIGGGVSFLLSRNVGLGLELHTITIFPDTTFAIDASVRLRLKF